jgi:ABC-type branched-subunit amino acid transport system substrate-binding protein
MMRRLSCLMLASLGGACSDGSAEPPISIGVVEPATGDLEAQGENQERSQILAIDEINAGGGVLGRRLTLAIKDDGTKPEGTAIAYQAHLAAAVPVILGPSYSEGVDFIAAQIRAGKTLTLSGAATAPALATLSDDDYFARTVPSDAVQAVVLARLIVKRGCKAVCIVHREDLYGSGLAAALIEHLRASDVTYETSPYKPGQSSFAEVMPECDVIRSNPEAGAVFITFVSDGIPILNDAARIGWNAVDHGIFFVDGNRHQELFDGLEQSRRSAFFGAVGTAASAPELDDTPSGQRRAAFQARFMARHPGETPGTFAENDYDTAYLAAIAIELAGSVDDRTAIRDAVNLTSAGPAVAAGDWAGIRAAIAAYGQIDYLGASGDVSLDPDNGELLPPYYIRQWRINENGQIEDDDVVTVTGP